MNSTRQALTQALADDTAFQTLGATVLQEEELAGDTPMPAVLLDFDGEEELRQGGRPFRNHTRELWNIWLLSTPGDYYTIGQLGAAVKAALHEASLDAGLPGGDVALEVRWVWSSKTGAYPNLGLHSQIQRYWVISQSPNPT